MPDDTRTYETHTDETRVDETPVPENEERAVGVASVPDNTESPEVRETAEAREAEAREAAAPEPAAEAGVPTQRLDGGERPVDDVPVDEAHDLESHDFQSHDLQSRDDEARDDQAGDFEAHADEPRDFEARDFEARDDGARDDEARADEGRDDLVGPDDAPVPAMAYELAGERTVTEDDVTHDELMPGDVPEQQVSGLFDQSMAGGFRERWQRVQMQFVDDPKSAADQARQLVDDVFTAAREALDKQRGALDSWQSGESGQPDDTERLRVAVRGYRDFLDRMLGL